MKKEIPLKKSLFVAIITGTVCSAIIISCFLNLDFLIKPTSLASSQTLEGFSSESEVVKNKTSVGLPVRIRIPKIKVDAGFDNVGITPKGAMDVPKGPAKAGWFKLGVRPGEIGSAVVAGHSGWKNRIPAIFDNLYKLKKGDKIYVEDENGIITTFVVREIRSFDPKADATKVFSSDDGKVHLNLITCGGIWDRIIKQFSKRLVVFADKE